MIQLQPKLSSLPLAFICGLLSFTTSFAYEVDGGNVIGGGGWSLGTRYRHLGGLFSESGQSRLADTGRAYDKILQNDKGYANYLWYYLQFIGSKETQRQALVRALDAANPKARLGTYLQQVSSRLKFQEVSSLPILPPEEGPLISPPGKGFLYRKIKTKKPIAFQDISAARVYYLPEIRNYPLIDQAFFPLHEAYVYAPTSSRSKPTHEVLSDALYRGREVYHASLRAQPNADIALYMAVLSHHFDSFFLSYQVIRSYSASRPFWFETLTGKSKTKRNDFIARISIDMGNNISKLAEMLLELRLIEITSPNCPRPLGLTELARPASGDLYREIWGALKNRESRRLLYEHYFPLNPKRPDPENTWLWESVGIWRKNMCRSPLKASAL